MSMIISVLGYAKSGKTTLITRLVRHACAAGARVGVVKSGRAHGHGGAMNGETAPGVARAPRLPDSQRAIAAGAWVSLFWSEEGVVVHTDGGESVRYAVPVLPPRARFFHAWREIVPPEARRRLAVCDLLLFEGRMVAGARVVQVRRGADRPFKYPVTDEQVLITGFPPDEAIGAIIAREPADQQ